MNVHWKKLTSESKEKPEQKFDAAFGTIFRIINCFQKKKPAKNSYYFFS
jgi:hypothetical protein